MGAAAGAGWTPLTRLCDLELGTVPTVSEFTFGTRQNTNQGERRGRRGRSKLLFERNVRKWILSRKLFDTVVDTREIKLPSSLLIK